MRLDKFLKLSRVIKRRTVANEVCFAKPGTKLKIGDIVSIMFGNGVVSFKVLSLPETVRRDEAREMYELIEDTDENSEE